MTVTTIIPTYKNEEMLKKNLALNIPFLKDTHVIVVNDDPNTPQLGYELHNMYPKIMTIQQEKNQGFSCAMNAGVAYSKSDFALFLNNDVILYDDSWKRALAAMKRDRRIFAISFAQREKNGSVVGANTGAWKNGLFVHSAAPANASKKIMWPEGGSCLVRIKTFIDLGGYDERFSPFYWEDVDLGYRAWKCGYTVFFDKEILVEHHHETTISNSYSKTDIATIASRNQFFFIWKNADSHYLREHLMLLLKLLLSQWSNNKPFIKGFLRALPHLPMILLSRNNQKKQWKLTDDEIIKTIHE